MKAVVSVRRGRLGVPAAAGGAYERGTRKMSRKTRGDAASAREASAGYPQAGVNGLELAPHADGCHTQYELERAPHADVCPAPTRDANRDADALTTHGPRRIIKRVRF